ncbi:MAG: LamG domain-containing protein [Alphaproteobacteria bacterium]|nr:LamG domain-containing protein [Alphaproteobacteria bacterium]
MSRCNMAAAAILVMTTASAGAAPLQVWKFDNLQKIGGVVPRVEGHPTIVDSPVGKAVRFNGRDDALFFPDRPLVGAKTFTIEAIIHPEGGQFQQRWMHIAETDPKTGLDANPSGTSDPNPRFMFELRAISYEWYLDAFVNSKSGSKALAFPDKTHPLGPWYAVAQTYDGKTYRSYVNGVLQGEAEVPFTPHGRGHMMVGVRMNHVNWFKGAIAEARFTPRALKPEELLKVPAQ